LLPRLPSPGAHAAGIRLVPIIQQSEKFFAERFQGVSGVQKLYFCIVALFRSGCKNTIFALLRKVFDLLTLRRQDNALFPHAGMGFQPVHNLQNKLEALPVFI